MKKIIIGIVAVGVIVGGYFVFVNKNTEKIGEEVKTDTQGKKMAFESFLKNDSRAYVCTVNQYVGDVESKGTVYIANGAEGAKISERNIRGEFNTSVKGMNVDTSFIMKDGFSYTWSSMMPNVGYKVKVEEGKESDKSTQTSGTYSFDATQIGDYDCKEWIVEPGKFALPSSVKFMDLGAAPTTQATPTTPKTTTPPAPKTTTTTVTNTTTTTTSTKKTFTLAELASHSTKTSCYTTIGGKVYDITSYIPRHPGGESKVLKICGKDGSSLFEDQHGGQSKPENILKSFEIGTLI